MTQTIKISNLPNAGVLVGTELVPIVVGGTTKQTTTLQIGALGHRLESEIYIVIDPALGDGVTDAAPAINYAFEIGEGRTVFVPKGTYLIGSTLKMGANTTLLCETPEGVIFNKNHLGTFLTNGYGYTTTSVIPAYGGNGGLTIDGGIWNGFANGIIDGYTHFALGFGTGIVVRNVTLLNAIGTGHPVDMAACDDVLFDNCKFLGHALNGGDLSRSDCIQLDACTAEVSGANPSFPYFGVPVRKLCKNVTVRNCIFGPNPDNTNPAFTSQKVGVGSHASVWGQWATNITVENCLFDQVEYAGVRVWKWQDVVVTGNVFNQCDHPVHITATTAGAVSAIDTNGVQQDSSDGSVNGLFVTNNSMNGSTGNDLYMSTYDYGSGVTTARHQNIKWIGNISLDNEDATAAMLVRYCVNSEFADNTINGCVRFFYLSEPTFPNDYISIKDNLLLNASISTTGNGSIHLIGATNTEISGNTIEGVDSRAIYCTQSASGGVIVGNSFDNIARAAVYIQSTSSNWLIEANKVGTTCTVGDEGAIRSTNTCSNIVVKGGLYGSGAPAAYLTGPGSYANVYMQRQTVYLRSDGWSHTGNTSETTLLSLTGVVPITAMGLNGALIITMLGSTPANNANVKTLRCKVNGTTVIQYSLANLRTVDTQQIITNRNNASVQVARGPTQASSFTTSTVAVSTYAFATGNPLDVSVTAELADGADTLTLERLMIEVVYGA